MGPINPHPLLNRKGTLLSPDQGLQSSDQAEPLEKEKEMKDRHPSKGFPFWLQLSFFLLSFSLGETLPSQSRFRITQAFPFYGGNGTQVVDIDGDGDLDSITLGGSSKTNSGGPFLFLINDGEGRFQKESCPEDRGFRGSGGRGC